MTDGNRQGICDIVRAGNFWQAQDHLDHLLHLVFLRAAIPDSRLLHLERRVFANLHRLSSQGQQDNSACLADADGSSYIAVKNNFSTAP